jgi:opacity protein-like surface antigen
MELSWGEEVMRIKFTLAIIASLAALPAVAADRGMPPGSAASPARGVYVGVIGGGGFSTATDVTQLGTAFFVEAMGGPLAVNAPGKTNSGSAWFVGGQVGYEWTSSAMVMPAFEIEGFYLSTGTRTAQQINPTDRLASHAFDNSFPMNTSVLLANLVLSFPTAYPGVTPYIGGGFGGALVQIKGANSAQIAPPEVGINHFNSNPDSSAWTFAAQAKAGVRVALGRNAYVFGEYRYLYVGAVDQTFGSTVYPTHAPTSAWTVRFGDTSHHLGTVGLGFNF